MLLRSDPVAHFTFASANSALRLPFSGDSPRAAGEDFQAPRLFERARNGRGREAAKLDDLFAAEQTRFGTRSELKMPARLRAERFDLQTRSQSPVEAPFDVLRTGWNFGDAGATTTTRSVSSWSRREQLARRGTASRAETLNLAVCKN